MTHASEGTDQGLVNVICLSRVVCMLLEEVCFLCGERLCSWKVRRGSMGREAKAAFGRLLPASSLIQLTCIRIPLGRRVDARRDRGAACVLWM